jgi:hypothetical protein
MYQSVHEIYQYISPIIPHISQPRAETMAGRGPAALAVSQAACSAS